MFTGIVEEVGTIVSITRLGKALRLGVDAKLVLEDLKIDDSISIAGVCQTVVSVTGHALVVEAVEETIRKTTFQSLRSGTKVNLERAMALGGRLGGHLVQGHVDCSANVLSIESETAGKLLKIGYPREFSRYLVNTGSICIDGVSLTIARLADDSFTVSVIPHTWSKTTLGGLHAGDPVNLEFDILGKYIERMMLSGSGDNMGTKKSVLDMYLDQPEF